MILFVNACVRKNSRTKRLAECLLSRIPGEIRELRLSEIAFPVTDEAFLEKKRSAYSGEEIRRSAV